MSCYKLYILCQSYFLSVFADISWSIWSLNFERNLLKRKRVCGHFHNKSRCQSKSCSLRFRTFFFLHWILLCKSWSFRGLHVRGTFGPVQSLKTLIRELTFSPLLKGESCFTCVFKPGKKKAKLIFTLWHRKKNKKKLDWNFTEKLGRISEHNNLQMRV